MPINEIEELKNQLVAQLTPVSMYLFGSFATGTHTEESDLDFYIVVEDGADDLADLTTQAYRAIRKVKKCPVDIIIGTKSRFEKRKAMPSVENEVYERGVLLYGSRNLAMD